MAHYAILDENNVVTSVITGRNENEVVDGITDWEEHYSQEVGFRVKRTSYNTVGGVHSTGGTPFRKNYAGIGMVYDSIRDAFYYPHCVHGSWIFDETSCQWKAPVAYPTDGKFYYWFEPDIKWVEITQ